MADSASIGIPTAGGVTRSLTDYAVGVLAGVGYRLVSGMTGSGLIGGAIAAGVVGAVVKGKAGEIIAINLGFQTGQAGIGGLGLGNMLGGLGKPSGSESPGLEVI